MAAIEKRLEKGGVEYSERSWDADPEKLVDEIIEELDDVAGWAFVLRRRLVRVKETLGKIKGSSRS